MLKTLTKFIELESASGILLFISALLALIVDNSPMNHLYQSLFNVPIALHVGQASLSKPLVVWINDGLMSVFFLLVGLEIKREMFLGELNSISKITLPGIGAVGGMIVPALIYILLNWGDAQALRAWAVPVATDIAFALGILYLLGSRIPNSLKVFLTALAIFDDLGAIVIIAVFYAHDISFSLLALSLLLLFVLYLLNRFGVRKLAPYGVVGFFLWVCVLESGLHPTFSAVLLAFAIPIANKDNPRRSPSRRLEKKLHPWVAYFVLPLFAFANAGISFEAFQWQSLFTPISLGVFLGLMVGKQIGVLGSVWLAVKLGFAKLPYRVTWTGMYGISLLCGVGFTMSLFIGALAFESVGGFHGDLLRSGVILGSLVSGVLGFIVLYRAYHRGKAYSVEDLS